MIYIIFQILLNQVSLQTMSSPDLTIHISTFYFTVDLILLNYPPRPYVYGVKID